jgi:hypothetical protein
MTRLTRTVMIKSSRTNIRSEAVRDWFGTQYREVYHRYPKHTKYPVEEEEE